MLHEIVLDQRPEQVAPAELVARIKAGNSSAEEELCVRYRPWLVVILAQRTQDRARAEDLAQDTLIVVLRRLRGKGIDQPELLPGFVRKTAEYICISWQRRRVNQFELKADISELAEDRHSPEEQLFIDRRRDEVRRWIASLPVDRDQEVLRRYYVFEHNKSLICDALDLSPAHFDRVIYRARERFRNIIEREGGNEALLNE